MSAVSSVSTQRSGHRAAPPSRRPSGLPSAGHLWSRALLLVIWAGVVAVLALWWQDTIPGSLRGGGDYVTAAGRLSGLLAAYLLLVLVALMARIPWLENRVGSDVVARYHRALGEYTVALAIAHAVLIVLGYAWQSGTNPVAETGTVQRFAGRCLQQPDPGGAGVARQFGDQREAAAIRRASRVAGDQQARRRETAELFEQFVP